MAEEHQYCGVVLGSVCGRPEDGYNDIDFLIDSRNPFLLWLLHLARLIIPKMF